jgi:predicted RNA-binding protein (virulence factor B family)
MEIGHTYQLTVAREVDFGLYLQSEKGDILLPRKYVPEGTSEGDKIDVFVHRDSEDRLLATTLKPAGEVGDIVVLTVKDTSAHGAFMDWGLEKDLFVPKAEQHIPFEKGDRQVVRIAVDYKTDRLLGTSKLQPFIKKDGTGVFSPGDEVDIIVYDQSPLGMKVIVNREYFGLLYHSDIFSGIDLGDETKGYIREVREDGKLDVTLRKEGVAAIDENRAVLLTALKANEGFLPLTDKSDPEDIQEALQMSKKAFKKALGGLYRERLVTMEEEGIRLIS